MKLRKDLVDYIYFGVFGIFIIFFLTGQFTQATGTTLVVIDNADPNSMFPTYFQGDLFVIHKDKPADIEIGDVIVYTNTNGGRVIHRVIDIVIENSDYFYRVKGDDPVTNGTPDSYPGGTLIPFDAVLGKVTARIPYIGHISLALQQNVVVQLMVLILAISVVFAILLWPEDEEEEEEDEYFNISRQSIRNFFAIITGKLKSFFFALTKSRYKFVAWLLVLVIIMAGVVPFFLPAYLHMPSGYERGVNQVDVDPPQTLIETVNGGNATFYNVFVTMYDSEGTLVNHIQGYTMQVTDENGTVIDETKWDTLRPIKGLFTVGGSISIDQNIYDNLGNDTQLTIEIVVHINEFGETTDLDPYQSTFRV